MSGDAQSLSSAVMPRVNAVQFAEIWNKYDTNGNGTIDGNELNSFYYDLTKKILKKEPTEKEFKNIRSAFMSAFDKTNDGKITMNELAKMLLPEDESFFLLFRRNIPLNSSVTFMKIWRKYDQNRSGYLNEKELKHFIEDYVKAAGTKPSSKKLQEYTISIMKLFDRHGGKKLDLQDMAKLVNVSENFLLQFEIQDGAPQARRKDFEKIFSHYDQSKTGALEGAELDGFVKDMMELIRGPLTAPELDVLKKKLLEHADANGDGVIQRSELAVCLGVKM